jgi:hypothetical protein
MLTAMNDDEFLHAFFSLELPHTAFRHRDHLRLAWLVVRRHGAGAAGPIVAAAIRRYARAHEHADRYHDTLTAFWVRLVAHAITAGDGDAGFDRFLAAHPLLLDPGLPLRHWSRDVLFSDAARRAWREPDVVPLPF